jgi:hypothetical protein
LNKVEVLPQDERGRVDASYKGMTGAEYDQLLDTIADVCRADDVRSRRPCMRAMNFEFPSGAASSGGSTRPLATSVSHQRSAAGFASPP